MTINRARFDLYLNTERFPLSHIADCVIEENAGDLTRVGFRYRPYYLADKRAFPLCPVFLPLNSKEYVFACRGGIPGFLDDYLPDDWGRKVIAYIARYRDQRTISSHSVIDVLRYLGNSRIGAIQLVEHGQAPQFDLGCEHALIANTERAAYAIEEGNYLPEHVDEMSLMYLAQTGTGVGGARPKALISKLGKAYLAKFNRRTRDLYNNARVEHACLLMAKKAGLNVTDSHIETAINDREVLYLERFDVSENCKRHHLVTTNALLKTPSSQRDIGNVFTYELIAEQLKKYSVNIQEDLEQLLRLMLFNAAINNTDDHERNFSLINRGEGFTLAPAYDMVPSMTIGEYHAAGFNYAPSPPKPSRIKGRVFGLSSTKVASIAEQVIESVRMWQECASSAEISDEEIEKLQRRIEE